MDYETWRNIQESAGKYRYEHVGTKNDGDGCTLHWEREEMENRTEVDGQHEGRYDREGTARGGKCKAL